MRHRFVDEAFDLKVKALCRFDVFAIDKRLSHQLTELLGLIRVPFHLRLNITSL